MYRRSHLSLPCRLTINVLGVYAVLIPLAAPAAAQVELYRIDGDAPMSKFGSSISAVGDLNGDGHSEFIAGASKSTASAPSYARVYSGADGTIVFDISSPMLGDNTHVVASGGDVNADGTPDFAVGMPLNTTAPVPNVGNIIVYSGIDGSILNTFQGEAAGDKFGSKISITADLNNDGYDDILGVASRNSSSPGSSGKCWVYSGFNGSILLTVERPSIIGFAWDADFAGDTNGDGIEDLVIGSPFDDDMGLSRGSVRIFSGADGALLQTVYGDTPAGGLGTSVCGVGDINQDGFGDVIAGAYAEQAPFAIDEGYAKVLSGADGSELFHFETSDPTVRLIGGSVSGPGDINQDGHPDFLVRVNEGYTFIPDFYGDLYFYFRGGARLYSGRDGSLLQEFGNDFDWTGRNTLVAGAGDVDADGTLDIMIGHSRAYQFSSQAGAVRVFAGVPDEFVESCNGDGGDQMGCTDCPCSNNAVAGTIGGCVNSAGKSSRLLAFGSPSVSNDTMRMEMTGGTSNAFAILSSGDNLAPANAINPCFGQNSGVTFSGFDGLRCAVGRVQRHGARATDSLGSVGITTPGWGPPNGPPSGLIAQGGFTSGQTRHYQVIYREEMTLGCMTGLNSSQSVSVSFVP